MLPTLTVFTVILMSFFGINTTVYSMDSSSPSGTIEIDYIDENQAYCGLDNGSAIVHMVGGPSTDYLYSIDGGFTFQESNEFYNLGIGDYLVIVTSSSDPNCWTQGTVQISNADDLTLTEILTNCETGINNSNLVINVSGGTPEFTVTWVDPNGVSNTVVSAVDEFTIPFTIESVVEGNYQIFVEDRTGCIKDTLFFVEECCAFIYDCHAPDIVVDCLSEVPGIPADFADNATNGMADLDALVSSNILTINANCYDAVVTAQDVMGPPVSCETDTLTIERIYNIDQNGTEYSCTQLIKVLYSETPTFAQEAQPSAAQCIDDVDAAFNAWLESAGGAQLTSCNPNLAWSTDPATPEITYTCQGTGSATVSFTYVDGCGNTGSTMATFSVEDTTPPEVVCPADLILECGEDIDAITAWLETASGSDACSNATMSNDFSPGGFLATCGDSGEYTVNFTATDDCGLTNSCPAKILIQDPNSYQLLCPGDLEIDLDDPGHLDQINTWLAEAYTEDPCFDANYEVQHDFDPASLEIECDYLSVVVQFQTINACGVERFCTAQILGGQEIGTEVNCPDDLVLECADPLNDSLIEEWLSLANAVDHEGNEVVLTNDYAGAATFPCGETLVIFSGEDNCGQAVACSANIIIEDTVPPVLNCPLELNLGCGYDGTAIEEWLNSVTADDDCSSTFISNDFDADSFVTTCGESGHYVVNFIATNECGLESTCETRINIIEEGNIGINCPEDLVLDLNTPDFDQAISDWLSEASVDDDCELGLQIVNDYDPANLSVDCEFLFLEVTFEVSTNCGALASCTATISGSQDTQPSMVCPEDLELSCGASENDTLIALWLEGVEAFDFAGAPLTVENNFDGLDVDCGSTTVLFSTIDNCENTIECEMTIVIVDDVAPEIVCPEEITIDIAEGNASVQIQEFVDNADITDNCSAEVALLHEIDADLNTIICGDRYTLDLTAIDECGNETTCQASVFFTASNDLAIECPPLLTLNCLEEDLLGLVTRHVNKVDVLMSDLDYQVIHDYDPSLVRDDCNEYIYFEVEFVATDECGNKVSCIAPVEILPEMRVFVPNIFTPDGDGLNDYVTVFSNNNVKTVKDLMIFDRWGNKVFHKTDFIPNDEESGWDGSFNGRLADVNVYSYSAIVEDEYGREEQIYGTVTLMR